MARIKVNYLTIDSNIYSDGQSIVSKEEVMMSDTHIQYYLDGAEERGLSFVVETEEIDVPDKEVEVYSFYGYQIL